MEQVDVLIVGSGPAGMSTALHLVKEDAKWAERIVIVDKAIHPREKLCGGGITHLGTDVLTSLGLRFEPRHFSVRETRLVYHDKSYSFRGNPCFRITRRDEFDHWLVRKGEERGITVRQGEAVKDIKAHDDFVEVTTAKTTFHAKVVIAADGSRSFVRTRLKWDDESRVARLLEVITPENPNQDTLFRDKVAVFDFSRMTDGLQGYYWDFPSYVEGKAHMNRGVFDSRARPERDKADLKQELRDHMGQRDRDLSDYKLKGHPIRWFDREGKFAMNRVILVGDAAGADPLFGEGIAFALGYGLPASDAVIDAFEREDFSFATYRQRIMDDGLFKHLDWRVYLARKAYILKYPRFIKAGWTVARFLVRLSRWRDPEFIPGNVPQLVLET